MNIERIEAHDFRSWGELDLRIQPGVTLISGANGAGKSSALEAVEFALFGATSDAGRLIRRGTDKATVEVRVRIDAGLLFVERTARRSGTSAKVNLDVFIQPTGEEMTTSITAATVTETQAILDGLLGVSREVLEASAFSMQHGGAAFTEAKPADRKRVFAEILALGFWGELHETAKAELRAAQSAAEQTRAQVEQLDGSSARARGAQVALGVARDRLDDAAIAEQDADANAARLAAEAEAAREARRQHAAAVEQQQRAQADHDRANADRQAADEALDRARAAAENAPSVEAARAARAEAEGALAEAVAEHDAAQEAERISSAQYADAKNSLANARRDHAEGEQLAERLRARLAHAEENACPECGQQLVTPEAKAIVERMAAELVQIELARDGAGQMASAYETRVAQLEASATFLDPSALIAARSAAQAAATKLAEAETIQSLAGSVEAAETRARACAARENEAHAALEAAKTSLFKWDSFESSAEHDHQAALTAVATARQAHGAAAAELARAEEAAKLAEREAAQETEARARLAEAERAAAIAGVLTAGFSPTGVQAMVVDSVLGDLADEANRVLAELASPIRVDLRSQRLTKDNRLVDTLEIIAIMDGQEAPYETLSGGERTRLALALRAALTRLLASKRGARVRLLVIDEPAGLDASGAEALAAVLNEFITARVFDSILLVTHHDALADLIGNVVRIAKNASGESRLVEAPAGSPTPSGDPERSAA